MSGGRKGKAIRPPLIFCGWRSKLPGLLYRRLLGVCAGRLAGVALELLLQILQNLLLGLGEREALFARVLNDAVEIRAGDLIALPVQFGHWNQPDERG